MLLAYSVPLKQKSSRQPETFDDLEEQIEEGFKESKQEFLVQVCIAKTAEAAWFKDENIKTRSKDKVHSYPHNDQVVHE